MSYIIDFLFIKQLAIDLQESKCLDACCFMALQDIESMSKGFAVALPRARRAVGSQGPKRLGAAKGCDRLSTDDGELGSYSARTLSAAKFDWQW